MNDDEIVVMTPESLSAKMYEARLQFALTGECVIHLTKEEEKELLDRVKREVKEHYATTITDPV